MVQYSKRVSGSSYLFLATNVFTHLPPIVCYLSVLLSLLFCTCIPKFQRMLRVISPLLIILTWREGSHWMLTVLLFIRELWPHLIQYEWRNVGVTNKLLGYLEYSHSPLPHWNWVCHVPSPLKWRFCQVLISTWLGMTYDRLGMPIITTGVMSWIIGISWFWKMSVQQDLVKVYPFTSHLQK